MINLEAPPNARVLIESLVSKHFANRFEVAVVCPSTRTFRRTDSERDVVGLAVCSTALEERR
jgi:hypothetical protein